LLSVVECTNDCHPSAEGNLVDSFDLVILLLWRSTLLARGGGFKTKPLTITILNNVKYAQRIT